MSQPILVTRDSIQLMLNNPNPAYVVQVVGRALVAIFKYQTEDEKITNNTKEHNGVGFAGCDARSGSLTAKSFMKHNTLLNWQIDRWTKISEKTGYARLCKYHNQLNTIANYKEAR